MPLRLVVQPVVVEGKSQRPLCDTIVDPGRAPKPYLHSSVYNADNTLCFGVVGGLDMSALDDNEDIASVVVQDCPSTADYDAWLNSTPDELNWPEEEIAQLNKLLGTNLHRGQPIHEWAAEIAKDFPDYEDIRKMQCGLLDAAAEELQRKAELERKSVETLPYGPDAIG